MRELCGVVISTKMRELCGVVISTKMRELCAVVISTKMSQLCGVVISTKMRELRRVLVSSGQTLGPCSPLLGTLPRPSISAEPGSVVPWGRPVSIVCRGPAGVTSFRLEKGNRKAYEDVGVTSRGEQETEARFHITTLSEDAVGPYRCIYQIESSWSALSEALSLEGTAEAVSALPAGPPGGVSSPTTQCCSSAAPSGLSTEQVYILIGVSVAFLLCLSLLVLLLLHRQLWRKRGPPRSKDEEQRLQGRLSPAVDVRDGTAAPSQRTEPWSSSHSDVASIDRFPDMDGEVGASTPAAGGPQEVTYARLNHKLLTQRVARAVSPPSSEPMAESSTYATIARH